MKLLIGVLLLVAQAGATVVSGRIADLTGQTLTSNRSVVFTLQNCGANIPRIMGSAVLAPATKSMAPNAAGLIAGTIAGNDVIECGTTLGQTYYKVEIYAGAQKIYEKTYRIAGATWNLSTAIPLSNDPTAFLNYQGYLLGDIIYGAGTNVLGLVRGNTQTRRKYFAQSGDGLNSAPPYWTDLDDFVVSTLPGLTGDVSNSTLSTQLLVNTVGGRTAASIAAAVDAVGQASSSGGNGTLVKRDGSGLFAVPSHLHVAASVSDFSTASDARISAQKGAVNGIATLDGSSLVPLAQIPSLTASRIADFSTAADARITAQKGAISGIATLDTEAKLPVAQLPGLTTSLLSDFSTASDARITLQKGANSGLATLDSGGKLTTGQIPSLAATNISDFSTAADARIAAQKGVNDGLATLGSDGKVPLGQVPALTASVVSDFSAAADARIALQKGAASGVATLDGGSKIPTAQIPALPYQAALGFTPENAANKGVNGGYAGLDADGRIPASQLPAASGMTALVSDTAPTLGGNLILNGKSLTGHLIFTTDNTYDIGASSATRPRNGYFAGTITAGTFSGSGASLTDVPWASLSSVPATIVYTSGSYTDPDWLTLTKAKVGLPLVENTALSTWAGTANITTIGTLVAGTVPWARLSDIPSTFAPSLHAASHVQGAGDPLSGTLAVSVTGNAGTVTNGVYTSTLAAWTGSANITAIGTLASGSVPWARLTSVPASFAPSAHTHPVGDLSTVGDYSSKITSGTYGISITGNAATVATLAPAASGAAPGANQLIRTDGSNYTYVGWLNTVSGDANTTAITRVYASSDAFLRYYTLANFTKQVMNAVSHDGSFAWYDQYLALPTGTVVWGVFQPQAATSTITSVQCWSDTGDGVIQLRRSSDNGDMINGNITCNGSTNASINGYGAIAVGTQVGIWEVSGSAKSIRVGFKYTTAY